MKITQNSCVGLDLRKKLHFLSKKSSHVICDLLYIVKLNIYIYIYFYRFSFACDHKLCVEKHLLIYEWNWIMLHFTQFEMPRSYFTPKSLFCKNNVKIIYIVNSPKTQLIFFMQNMTWTFLGSFCETYSYYFKRN